MVTFLLILVAVVLVVALIGVCCEICGGSFLGWMLLLQGAPGAICHVLCLVIAEILDGLKS